jgi:hypothetical protein
MQPCRWHEGVVQSDEKQAAPKPQGNNQLEQILVAGGPNSTAELPLHMLTACKKLLHTEGLNPRIQPCSMA